ncbi:MAG: protein tyrosine phosphatase family protein [Elainellaceae cyanobacterium]
MDETSPALDLSNIYHFLPISETIATAGQPTADQFAAIQRAGYQVVVNLALESSTNALPNEQELVEAQGMRYVHIPVIWEDPTFADFDRFSEVMQDTQDQKVFVHCAANMRVSAFMYLYRRLHQDISHEQAVQDLQQIWQPNPTWQQFIDQVLQQS